jgi:hypothetical protein
LARRDHSASRKQSRRRGAAAEPPEISQWAQTFGDNTRPGLYGILRFADISGAPESGDSARGTVPAPGLLLRGGQLPGRLPGFSSSPPIPEPPPPDIE